MMPMHPFNEEAISGGLTTAWAGRPLVFLESTGSTNSDVMALADQGSPQGTLVVSSQQTAGKGRRGRTWISPADVNIYMSILLRPTMPPEKVPMTTLVMALAVQQALEKRFPPAMYGCRFGIKWPNDIVVLPAGELEPANGAANEAKEPREQEASVSAGKICGILTEMRVDGTKIRDVVVGIGINVNMTRMPDEIRTSASSLRSALEEVAARAAGKAGEDAAKAAEGEDAVGTTAGDNTCTIPELDRAQITADVWNEFEPLYETFSKAESLLPLKEKYESVLVNTGRRVRVLDPQDPYEGTALGITEGGELIVMRDADPESGAGEQLCHVGNGEISVRGIEGYI